MKWFVLEFLPYEGYSFNEYDSQEAAEKSFNDYLEIDKGINRKTDDLILIKGEIIKRIPSEN